MKPTTPTFPVSTVERWLAILRLIAQQPGIKPETLREGLEDALGEAPGASTIYKDLVKLKAYGLLESGRHRQGYYMTGTSWSPEEAQVLLNGLRIQAEDLGNPIAAELYDDLLKRMVGKSPNAAGLSFPVEAIGNKLVVKTSREAFYDVMAHLREPLRLGQQVQVCLIRNTWEPKKGAQDFTIYPLQFIFHDIAWYLIAEDAKTRQFQALRVDRLHPAIQVLEGTERGSRVQQERLKVARALLGQSWAMCFPPHHANGDLTVPLEPVELHFGAAAAEFIAENQQRHPTQAIKHQKDGTVVFTLQLPRCPRVFFQFRRWVLSWGESVEVIAPAWFRDELAGELDRAMCAYQASETVLDPA